MARKYNEGKAINKVATMQDTIPRRAPSETTTLKDGPVTGSISGKSQGKSISQLTKGRSTTRFAANSANKDLFLKMNFKISNLTSFFILSKIASLPRLIPFAGLEHRQGVFMAKADIVDFFLRVWSAQEFLHFIMGKAVIDLPDT